MSAAAGTLFGNYRIVRPIGTGGFSTVYLANDDRLDTEVAVKVLAENRALDIDARRRFIEEAQKLRKVQSSTVVTVYDVGETEGKQPYMVLEYADRGDLNQRQRDLGMPVSNDGCAQLVTFLQESLAALHGVGLVHRDVKPHNILIRTTTGTPRPDTSLLAGNERFLLGDLGFVKDLTMASGLTVGGGTWAYQAPEQRKQVSSVDARTDIYSASAVVAWLLTGQLPADGQEWSEVLSQASVDPLIKTELLQGLQELPENRPASAEQWGASLLGVLQPSAGFTPQPAKLASHQPQSPPSSQTAKPRGLLLAAAAAVVGLTGFAAGWGLDGSNEPKVEVSEDGSARTVAEIEGQQVIISGPSEITVGESARFTSDLPSGATGSWIYPDGSLVELGNGVVYTADTEGSFVVTLLATVPGAEPELVHHQVLATK